MKDGKLKSHKTKKVKINNKFHDIDIGIIPLIKWINNFDGITTYFSCEGSHKNSLIDIEGDNIQVFGRLTPYISFFNKNDESVKLIITELNNSKIHYTLNLSYNKYNENIVYTISFNEKRDMVKFRKYINENRN